MNKNPKLQYVTKEEADEMIENALRRHNRGQPLFQVFLDGY